MMCLCMCVHLFECSLLLISGAMSGANELGAARVESRLPMWVGGWVPRKFWNLMVMVWRGWWNGDCLGSSVSLHLDVS